MNTSVCTLKRVFVAVLLFGSMPLLHVEGRAEVIYGFAFESGDTNGDSNRDLSDGLYLLDHLFVGGPAPVPYACGTDIPSRDNGDVNGDSVLDLSDGVYLLGWLFLGGPEPVEIDCLWGEGSGAAAATQRSIDEFVAVQGTFCIVPPDDGCESIGAVEVDGCCLFVPPIENFFGWSDPGSGLFASVDFFGNAEEWIQGASGGAASFGTTTTGSVTERPLADGQAEIHVRLHTKNALSWAFEFDPSIPGNPFANTPLIFGHKAPEILADGLPAALSDSLLHVVFIAPEPGAPLPDLFEANLQTISFYSNGEGPLRELFGVEEGTRGRLQITQVGLLALSGQVPPNAATADAFPAEHIKVRALGGK